VRVPEGLFCAAIRLNDLVSFAWGEEKVGFKAVLAGIKIVVTAMELVESLVGAPFHDPSLLDDEDLVGTTDGREAVGDHEGRTTRHQEI
jgi:hypothetical protein